MGTISAVRLINVNYNNNSIRINDETLHFNNENTLVSLANGGGKTVLVQMLSAPFVHKRYRNTTERSFESFFTTSKPTFILVEWQLDGGVGKMMNGFMVRRSQSDIDSEADSLDIIAIISEYTTPCMWDINNLPVVEKSKKEMSLKNFTACRQIFEGFKKDRDATFFCYDINNSSQQRQYFDKLKEYDVDYKEWEDIIKKINMKEGGLAELFSDCKEERGLIEKWFLESIEKKLDKEGSRVKEFERIVSNYVRQCYENEDKIKRKGSVQLFKEYVYKGTAENVGLPEINNGDTLVSSTVMDMAEKVDDLCDDKTNQEYLIASFRSKIAEMSVTLSESIYAINEELEELALKIDSTKHEMFSNDIYVLKRKTAELDNAIQEQNRLMEEIDARIKNLEINISLQINRKLYDRRVREKREYNDIFSRLESLKKQDDEIRPRREELGKMLKLHYKSLVEVDEKQLDSLSEEQDVTREQIDRSNSDIEECEKELEKLLSEKAKNSSRIEGFSKKEDILNTRYKLELSRNILEKYEEGSLEVLLEQSGQEKNEIERNIRVCKDKLAELEIALKKNESDGESARTEAVRLEAELTKTMELLRDLEKEAEIRRSIVRYVGLGEDNIFETELIKEKLNRKIKEQEEIIRRLNEQEKALKKEYEAISEGRIFEIPENFRVALDKTGISPLYGLEWLRNNGRSFKENQNLIHLNPFIPYSLIMTEDEYSRIKLLDKDIYTLMPVPVIIRSELEDPAVVESINGTVELKNMRFYVRFNEGFLSPKKLQVILEEKLEEIKAVVRKTEIRNEEKTEYNRKLGVVENQKLTSELYNGTVLKCSNIEESKEIINRKVLDLRTEKDKINENIRDIRNKCDEYEKHLREQKIKIKDVQEYISEYEIYLGALLERARIDKDISYTRNKKDFLKNEIADLYEKQTELDKKKLVKANELDGLRLKASEFEQYDSEMITLSQTDLIRMDKYESEYDALATKISADMRLLEASLKKQEDRLREAKKEYDEGVKKSVKNFDLNSDEYEEKIKNLIPDSGDEKKLEQSLKATERERKETEKELHSIDKEKARAEANIENKIKEMERECGRTDILPEEDVVPREYLTELKLLKNSVKEKGKELTEAKDRHSSLEAVLSGLVEYEDSPVRDDISYEKNISIQTKEELDREKAALIKELSAIREDIQKSRRKLEERIRELAEIPEFRDDYFKKPLMNMLRLIEMPGEVVRQIETTVKAYEELLRKLEVDLEIIDKENRNITNELMEYVKAVHIDMGKIDDNSTIRVRDRDLKMLEIILPDWAENETQYSTRMKDYLAEITERGIKALKSGENVTEYFGTRLSTKMLYDTVVGINSIQIKLYKIEEQKEYPINWADVAKNSGGEGFVSTFVIISCLLSYIRKDESDIFFKGKESKVMIMDNPFGVTYSEHLLKPLIEMARKNNTQLICFSGLGGDPIFGRFNNIYVLNRVAAGLKNGQFFLRSEHLKGNEPEKITVSRFLVTEAGEQLTLF